MSDATELTAEAVPISESARDLLRRRLAGERVEVTDETCDAYRELSAVGYAEPVHTPRGRDSHYRLTLAAMGRKAEIIAATLAPSPRESAAPAR